MGKKNCKCNGETYELKATGYIMCIHCGKQFKDKGDSL